MNDQIQGKKKTLNKQTDGPAKTREGQTNPTGPESWGLALYTNTNKHNLTETNHDSRLTYCISG